MAEDNGGFNFFKALTKREKKKKKDRRIGKEDFDRANATSSERAKMDAIESALKKKKQRNY